MSNAAHEQLREENQRLRVAIAVLITDINMGRNLDHIRAELVRLVPDWSILLFGDPLDELVINTSDLPWRAAKPLAARWPNLTMRKLRDIPDSELLKTKNFGSKALKAVREWRKSMLPEEK